MTSNSSGKQIYRRPPKRASINIKFILFAFFLILVIAAAVVIICNIFLFRVENIVIEGNEYYFDEKVIEAVRASGIKNGTAMLALDLSSAERKITEEMPYIKKADIKIQLPRTLRITLENDVGAYRIRLGGEYYILSRDFKALCKESDIIKSMATIENENTNLNKILFKTKSVSKCFVGENVVFSDVDTKNIMTALYNAFEENDVVNKINEIDINDKFNIYFIYDNRLKIIFGNFDDIDVKMKFAMNVVNFELHADDRGIVDATDKKEIIFLSRDNIY